MQYINYREYTRFLIFCNVILCGHCRNSNEDVGTPATKNTLNMNRNKTIDTELRRTTVFQEQSRFGINTTKYESEATKEETPIPDPL